MKQPFWKVLASYFIEIPIEHLQSEINDDLHLTLNNGRYQLSTNEAIYSYADLYDNFTKSFKKISFKKNNLQDALILGFGLGSIPFMLEKKFHQPLHYVGVEMDEVVIYLAHKYVLPDLDSSIELIQADAKLFVAQTEQSFDLICVDLFIDSKVPREFETEAFLTQLKHLLLPGGLLLFNKLANDSNSIEQTKYFFEYTFKNIFPRAVHLDVGGNWMLFSDRDKLIT